jgi:hypothetical protein
MGRNFLFLNISVLEDEDTTLPEKCGIRIPRGAAL